MKVLVLAGGLGTRLRPRFGDLPKPLAPIGGRPFVVRQLDWLRDHGLLDIVICAGYGADELEEALGDGGGHGVRLTWSRESEPLGTGGALRLLRGRVPAPFLVVNGDTLPELDPWALERARWEHGSAAAVALFQAADASALGRVECDSEGWVTRFVEKDPTPGLAAWVNGGCYAFDARLWEVLPDGRSSLERDVLPALAERGELFGHRVDGRFYDIGTPEGWAKAQERYG